jgi:hypothetical protein
MKQLVKGLLYKFAPRWTTGLMSARARAHSHRVVASWGGAAVARKLVEHFGSRVQEGPFAGLTLTPATHAEQIGPYLLGVYESELDEAWDTVFRRSYPQIIDIGAKFGYYAVGLARRYPQASVVAFDTDRWARRALREMAAANGTRNVDVLGFCSPEWLARHVADAALVVSDCEGYEDVLFGPGTIASLRSATLVIETHDGMVPGVSDRLRSAFDATHAVRAFGHTGARRSPGRALDFLSGAERTLAVQEVRPPQVWLLCVPRAGQGEGPRPPIMSAEEVTG